MLARSKVNIVVQCPPISTSRLRFPHFSVLLWRWRLQAAQKQYYFCIKSHDITSLQTATLSLCLSLITIWFHSFICFFIYRYPSPPLWSSGQSSWLQSRDVLCFLWDMNWIYICCVEESRPPLWSSGQGSWLQIQRYGFVSRRYQIFWGVVGLERGLLSLVSTIEELLERKISGSCLQNRDYGCSGSDALTMRHPSIRKSWH
jgi:hypothetical protein